MSVYLMDGDAGRAERVRCLFRNRNLPDPKRIEDINAPVLQENAIVVVHWTILDQGYSILSRLRLFKNVRMIFYSFCKEKRQRGDILLLPEEFDEMSVRIRGLTNDAFLVF